MSIIEFSKQIAPTLTILIGASQWPELRAPLNSNDTEHEFLEAYSCLIDFFNNELDAREYQLLDLFNQNSSIENQINEIDKCLQNISTTHIGSNCSRHDVIVYYIGHAIESYESPLLPVRSSKHGLESATCFSPNILYKNINRKCPSANIFYILDCCFASAFAHKFDNYPWSASLDKQKHQPKGTAFLCATSAFDVTRKCLFTKSIVNILSNGIVGKNRYINLNHLKNKLCDLMPRDSAIPQLHQPWQSIEEMNLLPLFPNPGKQTNVVLYEPCMTQNLSVLEYLTNKDYPVVVAPNVSRLQSLLKEEEAEAIILLYRSNDLEVQRALDLIEKSGDKYVDLPICVVLDDNVSEKNAITISKRMAINIVVYISDLVYYQKELKKGISGFIPENKLLLRKNIASYNRQITATLIYDYGFGVCKVYEAVRETKRIEIIDNNIYDDDNIDFAIIIVTNKCNGFADEMKTPSWKVMFKYGVLLGKLGHDRIFVIADEEILTHEFKRGTYVPLGVEVNELRDTLLRFIEDIDVST